MAIVGSATPGSEKVRWTAPMFVAGWVITPLITLVRMNDDMNSITKKPMPKVATEARPLVHQAGLMETTRSLIATMSRRSAGVAPLVIRAWR